MLEKQSQQESTKCRPTIEQIQQWVLEQFPVLKKPNNEQWFHGACFIVYQFHLHRPDQLNDLELEETIRFCINFMLKQTNGNVKPCANILLNFFKEKPQLLTKKHYKKLTRLFHLAAQLGLALLNSAINQYNEENSDLFCAMLETVIELKPKTTDNNEMTFYLNYTSYFLGRLIQHAAYKKLNHNDAKQLVAKYCRALFNLTTEGGTYIERPLLGVMFYNDSFVLDPEFGMYIYFLILGILEGENYSEAKLTRLFRILATNTKAVVEDTIASYYKEFDRRTKGISPEILARIKEGRKEDERLFGKHNYSVKYSVTQGSVSSIITTLHRHYAVLFEDEKLSGLSQAVACAAAFFETANTKLDYSTFRVFESTIHDCAHQLLVANDNRRERFLDHLLALEKRIQLIDNSNINLKKIIYFPGNDFNKNHKDETVIGLVQSGIIKVFVTLMASIITIEDESAYQMGEAEITSLFTNDTEEQFLENFVFADSIVLPLVKNNQLNLACHADCDKISAIHHAIDNFNIPNDKKQVILHWFLKRVVSDFEFYHHAFSDLSDLEQCCQIIAENTFEHIRILCDVVFTQFINERPERHDQISNIFKQLKRLVAALEIAHFSLKSQKLTTYKSFSYQSDFISLLNTFLPMIFRINQELELTPEFTDKIVAILSSISTETELRTLKLVLQYTPHVNDIADILNKELRPIEEHPSRDQFTGLSKAEQLRWLTYYSAMRVRQGLGALNHVLKNANCYDSEHLCAMLHAFTRIGVSASAAKFNRIYRLLSHECVKVRAHAAIAIWFIEQNPNNKQIKSKLINELIESTDPDYQTALLNTLSFYHYDQTDLATWTAVVEKSRDITDIKLLKHYALALSRIPCRAGLLRALELVNSTVWDEYNYCHNYHERSYGHKFFSILMFLHTPHWWHNRPLMIRRIKRLLATLSDIDVNHTPEHLQADVHNMQTLLSRSGGEIRYENMQLTLPENTVLLRGICARHGDALERKAVIDFIMKGSSSIELQGHEDDKASHAASNNIYAASDFDVATSYYKQDSGILMAIKSEYFNQEAYRGFIRTQIEGSRHYIFLRGIPLYAIKKIFFPQCYQDSLELLRGITPVRELQTNENFAFRELDKHRLHQMRHSVRSFIDRVVFVQADDSIPDLLLREDCHTPTFEDISATTIREHIKGELIAAGLEAEMWQYQTQQSNHDFWDLFSAKTMSL